MSSSPLPSPTAMETNKLATNTKPSKHGIVSDDSNVIQEGDAQESPDPAQLTKIWGPSPNTGLSFKDALLSTAKLPPIYTGSDNDNDGLDQEDLKPWRKALILKLLGKTVSSTLLPNKLAELWKPKYPFELVDLGMNFFMVRFRCKDDYDFVLEKGPWMIMGHYLTVRTWKPDFKPGNDGPNSSLVWAKLTCLPVEYYDDRVLFKIGNALGKAVKVDKRTMAIYARLCIEIDLSKPLPPCIWISEFLQAVEYEGLHLICFECGKSGHQREACPRIPTRV